jgi:hypothetical protein
VAGIDELGRLQIAVSFGNRPSEHLKLARLVKRHDAVLVGVEDSGKVRTRAPKGLESGRADETPTTRRSRPCGAGRAGGARRRIAGAGAPCRARCTRRGFFGACEAACRATASSHARTERHFRGRGAGSTTRKHRACACAEYRQRDNDGQSDRNGGADKRLGATASAGGAHRTTGRAIPARLLHPPTSCPAPAARRRSPRQPRAGGSNSMPRDFRAAKARFLRGVAAQSRRCARADRDIQRGPEGPALGGRIAEGLPEPDRHPGAGRRRSSLVRREGALRNG